MATRKSSSKRHARPTVTPLTSRLALAVEMAHEIDALFHYLASQTHFATNADDDAEDWNYGDDMPGQRDPYEQMRQAASMRGLELTTALMSLENDPNMDECKAVADKGNALLCMAHSYSERSALPPGR